MTADPYGSALLTVATWLLAYILASISAGLVLGRIMSEGGAANDGEEGLTRVPSVLRDRDEWIVEILDTRTSPRAPSTPNARGDHARRRTHRIDRSGR
jgi:hypothetical protein